MSSLALLQAAVAESWQSQILGFLLTVLVTVVTGLVPLLYLYLRRRWKLDISAAEEERISGIITAGIHYAEEQARQKIKAGFPPVAGEEKYGVAAEFVFAELARAKLPEMAADTIKRRIEAALPPARQQHDTPPLPNGTSPPAA